MKPLLPLFIFVAALLNVAAASPSVFPENALFAGLGYGGGVAGAVGAEFRLPLPIFDASLGLEATAPLGRLEDWQVRLSASALAIPALGTNPPLALGLGIDAGVSADGPSAHFGPIVGSDLLFSLDVPMTVSAYVAPGYARGRGFSLAWAGQVRYYWDDVALEFSSSDLTPLRLGARFLF